jgi:hypothetical protein
MRSILVLALVLPLLAVTACAHTPTVGDVRRAAVDCTTARASEMITKFAPAVSALIAKARGDGGTIDTTRLKTSLASLGLEAGACVAADLAASALAGRRSLVADDTALSQSDGAAVADALHDLHPDVVFTTAAGTL